jgi:hypothetical protein
VHPENVIAEIVPVTVFGVAIVNLTVFGAAGVFAVVFFCLLLAVPGLVVVGVVTVVVVPVCATDPVTVEAVQVTVIKPFDSTPDPASVAVMPPVGTTFAADAAEAATAAAASASVASSASLLASFMMVPPYDRGQHALSRRCVNVQRETHSSVNVTDELARERSRVVLAPVLVRLPPPSVRLA